MTTYAWGWRTIDTKHSIGGSELKGPSDVKSGNDPSGLKVPLMSNKKSFFSTFANAVADWSGKPVTFVVAFVLVLAWAVTGPLFQYSETWQLIINTSTTIVTFLMVFVLQNSQNRDGKALQAKLDELILSSRASNEFVGAEKLSEEELRAMSDKLEKDAANLDDVADRKSIQRSRKSERPKKIARAR